MSDLVCTTEQGQVKGQKRENIDGNSFSGFLGIPYAKPPLAHLRFKDPQPPESWNGVKDATQDANMCYASQFTGSGIQLFGSEDCLYLNVFTHGKSDGTVKPVMVFIHGGAFTSGSSNSAVYGPDYLMTEDIVLVTINYRIGALGFLKIDDPCLEVAGNAGLKDQVAALKWVQKNIEHFGGDPNNVTIFGESAGAASVHFLVLSPLAKGLFHKAIMQSGSVFCPWVFGVNSSLQLAQSCGFTGGNNTEEIFKFLQEIPVENLVKGQMKLGDWLTAAEKRWVGPTIEPKSECAFISEDPMKLIDCGEYNQVPLLIGYTSLESIFEEESKSLGFQSNWKEFIPYYFGFEKNSETYKKTNEKICKFYFGREEADLNQKEALYKVLTDTMFLYAIYMSVKGHAKINSEPVYYYRMSIETTLNVMKNMLQLKTKGVSHADDLGYLFRSVMAQELKPGSLEEVSIRRFVKLWTNFAKTGNPTPFDDSSLGAIWKPVTENELNFLDIGENLVPGVDPDIDRMKFWEEISSEIEKFVY